MRADRAAKKWSKSRVAYIAPRALPLTLGSTTSLFSFAFPDSADKVLVCQKSDASKRDSPARVAKPSQLHLSESARVRTSLSRDRLSSLSRLLSAATDQTQGRRWKQAVCSGKEARDESRRCDHSEGTCNGRS